MEQGEDEEDIELEDAPPPQRATPLLAIARIVCVLGMSLAVSGGLFMLLGGWLLPASLAFLAFLPFFSLMRFMEKRAARDDDYL